jgi:hypothetical protein
MSEIELTDHQLDALVYELYGLTEEEIKKLLKSLEMGKIFISGYIHGF